jgi:cell shape-determining protein MreD
MKLVTLLSRVTALCFAAFSIGVIFDMHAGALFGCAVSAFLLLTVTHDYSGPVRRWEPRLVGDADPARRSASTLRLAA